MLANLTASGYDVDDVIDGILDALGDSLDNVTGNLAGLSDETRFVISENTLVHSTIYSIDGPPVVPLEYFTSAETKAIAAMLYQLQSYAYLVKAVDMGFDYNEILWAIDYYISTGEVDIPDDYSPFANGFLGIDNEDVAEAVADAEASFLKSLSLMHEAMTTIAAREAEGTEDALLISPDNFDPYTWGEISDYLLFADHVVGEIENSVLNDVQAIIPLDWIENPSAISGYVAADFANWPTEVSMILEDYDDYWYALPDGCASFGINFSRIFDPTTSLLSILLELDASGDIQLYTFDESGNPVAAVKGVDAFDPSAYYYFRIPDVTLNGLLSLDDLPMTLEQLNTLVEYDGPGVEEPVFFMVENADGTVSWYWSMNYLCAGLAAGYSSYGVYQYPLAYHILTDAETYTADIPVRMSYGLVSDKDFPGYKNVYFDNTMDLTSTGSFWSTLPEFGRWVNKDPSEQYNDMSMYKMTAENPFQLPMDSYFDLGAWDSVYPDSGDIYFEYTADKDGVVTLYNQSYYSVEFWKDGEALTDLTSISVMTGDVITGYSNAYNMNLSCIYDDGLGDISSMGSAYALAENTTVQGRIHYGLPADYFVINPTTDRVRIQLDSPDVPSSIQIPGIYTLYHNFNAYNQYGNQIYYTYRENDFEIDVSGLTYLVLGSFKGLDYIISWEDVGDPLPIGGVGTFLKRTIADDLAFASSAYPADMDGDGDMDVFGSTDAYNILNWWENDGNGYFSENPVESESYGAFVTIAIDMDDDGDLDILGASAQNGAILWWENDGSENFTRHIIDSTFSGGFSVYATDMDKDGDVDVLGTSVLDGVIAWWENDGYENFTTKHTIDSTLAGACSVYTADMDGDGDVDVLGAGIDSDTVAWWENDGYENFIVHILNDEFNGACSVFAEDLDRDGDIDIIGAGYASDTVAWWENNGSGYFNMHIIDNVFDCVFSVIATDMDGDGDIDLLGSAIDPYGETIVTDTIVWWENDGSENFSKHVIDSTLDGVLFVHAADMDGDGDNDVIGSAVYNDAIVWWENDYISY